MKNKIRNFFVQAFEVFFIMVLCFATLLTSMLLNGAVIVGDGATGKIDYLSAVTPLSVSIIIVILAVYLVYLLKKSNKELHIMINQIYGGTAKEETPTTLEEPVQDKKEEIA